MRCRATSSAAQSFQHLWISDSALSEAFHRFARVSLAEANPRRHGSNVPGPLEAKRRLSRRRMGMTTVERGGGGAPPGEEVGVFFKFGRKRTGPPIGSEFLKAWTYQAPYAPVKLPQQRLVDSRYSPGLYWPTIWSDGLPWELEREGQQKAAREDARLEEFLHIAEPDVEDSQALFDELLEPLTAKEAISDNDLEAIFEMLNNAVQEAGGHKLIRLIEILRSHSVSQQTWRRFAFMIKAKDVSRNISLEELLTIFKLVLGRTEDWHFVSFLFASRVRRLSLQDCLLDALKYILTSHEHKAKAKTWLLCIQAHHESIRNGDVQSRSWRRLYGLLAEHFQPSDPEVVQHFGRLKRSELARVLLEHYLPGWIDQAERLAQSRNTSTYTADAVTANHVSPPEATHLVPSTEEAKPLDTFTQPMTGDDAWAKIIHMFTGARHNEAATAVPVVEDDTLSTRAYESRLKYLKTRLNQNIESKRYYVANEEGYSQTYAVVDLVNSLAHFKIPYTRLLIEVTEIYIQTQRNTTTKNFFMELRRRKNIDIPSAVAAKLANHFVAQNEINFAFDVLRSVRTLPLLPYAELLLKLIQQGKTHGAYIFEMLTRSHPDERIPEPLRTHRRLSLKQEHIDLVHEAAYAFASSEHLKPRTAFRRVWECYRFLRDRRAPIQPLISRAFVKAGISRPLKESERLSEQQVKYIISIVNQVEGPVIAKQVDQLAWEVWTGTLERQWERKYAPPAKGPTDQGRFYMNRRRLWMKGGGRIYVSLVAHRPADDVLQRLSDDVDRDITAPGDLEGITVDADPRSSQLTTYEPMATQSSSTEINEVLGARTTTIDDTTAVDPAFCETMPENHIRKADSAVGF